MNKPRVPKNAWLHYFLILLGVTAIGAVMLAGYRVKEEIIAPEEELLNPELASREALQGEIQELVQGYPMEQMAPYIARQDRPVAAYLVSIAKKESNWGKRVPVDALGKDCFNYWGYRDPDDASGSGGHTCFHSPGEAVHQVAGRIRSLVYEEHRDTPAKMIVWKCGYDCSGQDTESVSKWKRDVTYYFKKMIP